MKQINYYKITAFKLIRPVNNRSFRNGSVLLWISSLVSYVYNTDHYICKLNANKNKCFFEVKCKVSVFFSYSESWGVFF